LGEIESWRVQKFVFKPTAAKSARAQTKSAGAN
jgi:hypothetical protein